VDAESILINRIDGIVLVNRFGGPGKGVFLIGFYRWERRDLFWGRPLLGFPESQMLENFTYYGPIFEEGNDLHREPALGADQRRNEIDFLDEPSPGATTGPAIGGVFRFREGFCCRERRTERGRGLLSQAPAFIGVPAQVTDELLAGIGNMIGNRSENFQRIPVGDIDAEQRVARRGLASIRYRTIGTIVGKAVEG